MKTNNNRVLDYERIHFDIWQHLYIEDGEFVIQRRPFRWHKNGKVISNAYESFSMGQVLEDRGWEAVAAYGDSLAVCRVKPTQENGGAE